MKWLTALVAGGAATAAALLLGTGRANASERVRETSRADSKGRIKLRLTTYWPFEAKTEAERRLEGGVKGAAKWRDQTAIDPETGRRPELHPLEDVLVGKASYVSLAGDPAAWPFGQRIEIDAWPGVVFRVVDTGENFAGRTKENRRKGFEPIDVCIRSKSTRLKVPEITGARIVPGDNWEGGAPVSVAYFKGQNVTLTGYCFLGGLDPLVDCTERGEVFAWTGRSFTEADCEALARAVASSCPSGSIDEKQAVAWACRNRAAKTGRTIAGLVVPEGVFGPRDGEGGRDFVSTEADPDDVSRMVAAAVLTLRDEEDPTGGAFDFWNPSQQDQAKILADVQAILGEEVIEVFGSDDVRRALGAYGLRVLGCVGELELLG